ncbi:unnamed protein product [Calicophoron daubneyi]|uniref:RRM domain-containing protein n=1 Tax=Calicophoron daubneyi TaxID=300641 RepID=A0AAV2THF0_CALDB
MSVIIRLQNLPMSANASNIRRFFGGLAIPEGGVHIVGGNDGDAFIAFATDEDARKAMLLDRQAINGASIRLFLSSKTEMQSVIESARSSALFSSSASAPSSQPIVPQKTETMQALDVTAPTLPSSFPSYRNGSARDSYAEGRADQFAYGYKQVENPTVSSSATFVDDSTRVPSKSSERVGQCEPGTQSREREPCQQAFPPSRFDDTRNRGSAPASEYGMPPREPPVFENSRASPHSYRGYYGDSVYDRRPNENRLKDPIARDMSQGLYEDNYSRARADVSSRYENCRSPKPTERFPPRDSGDPGAFSSPNQRAYPHDRRPGPPCGYEREPPFPGARSQGERDFSVRPPWLRDEVPAFGPKRPFQAPNEYDDYPRKRRPVPPSSRPPVDSVPSETDFVVRVTLPVAEVGIKSIFEVLRGVHIVPKWGIRVEEDALQRPTGYVFIMMTARESFDRALGYDGRNYKDAVVKVTPSSLTEFYRVQDPGFKLKCPPEVAQKLPSPDQPAPPPHYADGCLEIAEVPPDATKDEIVRFIGAPGLSDSNVVIARFPPGDKAGPQGTGSVRALVSLPSAKDLEILLSAKPRPLRPDGAFPPVRLTPISRPQLNAYSTMRIEEKPKSASVKQPELVTSEAERDLPKSTSNMPLTCAYLSGLSRFLKDSEVHHLFPSVLIPGDAIRMVGPDNKSAYIDFISENNCRRAVSDITANDSKAKLSHPGIRIEAISRTEMEHRLGSSLKSEETPNPERSVRQRDRDPREVRSQWDAHPPRVGRPPSPANFRGRSPARQPEDSFYDHPVPPKPFDDHHGDPYASRMRHVRPPMDIPHSGPRSDYPPPRGDYPPPRGDYLPPRNDYPRSEYPPPRPGDHQLIPAPARRPGLEYFTVFLGNLPPTVTLDQLASIMRDYYFVPGSIRLRRDPQGVPTGEALVDFSSSYDADRIIRELNGYRLSGRPMILQYDHRP